MRSNSSTNVTWTPASPHVSLVRGWSSGKPLQRSSQIDDESKEQIISTKMQDKLMEKLEDCIQIFCRITIWQSFLLSYHEPLRWCWWILFIRFRGRLSWRKEDIMGLSESGGRWWRVILGSWKLYIWQPSKMVRKLKKSPLIESQGQRRIKGYKGNITLIIK